MTDLRYLEEGADPYLRRFAQLIQAAESGCWEWTGGLNAYGYGRVTVAPRTTVFAHRLAWEILRGSIPAGRCVLHTCDNRRCVNPNHLFLGDRGDNARDMAAKGRQFLQQYPERARRGEQHHATHLTDEAVLEIRERCAAGRTLDEVADEFGVHRTVISKIALGRAWSHVGGPRSRRTPGPPRGKKLAGDVRRARKAKKGGAR